MPRTIHALFVGIDKYAPPVTDLRGCVNDVEATRELLAARAKSANETFLAKTLTNEEATRENIIHAFREHLGKATAGDVALFCYSGHGSQEQAPPEFWHVEPDHLNETLVCHDSRLPGHWDLADKELALLIEEVAKKGAHVAILLDCCNSGSGTRAFTSSARADSMIGIRQVPTDHRIRPLKSFLEGVDLATSRDVGEKGVKSRGLLPAGRHILLAACRSDEEAKEYAIAGKPRGVFSHFLGETLAQTPGPITYRELFKRVSALVRTHAALQSPQAEPTKEEMLDEGFLGMKVPEPSRFYTLHAKNAGGESWAVDAGAVHGIPEPAGKETTTFAIFPRTADGDDLRELAKSIGTATVTEVSADHSIVKVEFKGGKEHAAGEVYKAVVLYQPIPLFKVHFGGDAAGTDLAREALASSRLGGGPSLEVAEATKQGDAVASLIADATPGSEHFRIVRASDGRRLVADLPDLTEASAKAAIQRLEHIARWTRIVELQSPPSPSLDGKIELKVYSVKDDNDPNPQLQEGSEARLTYRHDGTQWVKPRLRVEVTNHSDRTVFCALLGLSPTFSVVTGLLTGMQVGPGETIHAYEKKSFGMNVPDALWKTGTVEVKDTLKLIASTTEFDARLLKQGDLDVPLSRVTARGGIGPMSSLKSLLTRVQTRGFDLEPEEIDEWTTFEFSIVTTRPQDGGEISPAADTQLFPGVKLRPHGKLKAKARLTSAPVASRDVKAPAGTVLPPLLRDDPSASEPFLFSGSRGGEPGLGVLEIHDVDDSDVVTPESPLLLEIDQVLAPGEHVLPVAHDGQFYLPLGRSFTKDGKTVVMIQALPIVTETRSLLKAVKIYFQKVVSKLIGTEYPYPLLASYTTAADGKVTTDADAATVAAQVAKASRILLYVHGIIGETRGMADSSAGLAGPPAITGLSDRYDLILTFDYENLETPIEDIAHGLKQRLAAVGLGEDHGKTLHVVAHSMGGLVSRWFIENLGGNKVVNHLVMLGTPNGGSPWSSIEDWAITALSLGLNALVPVPWVGKVLGGLLAAVEKIDVTLDQMKPGSDFLKKLNESPDPGIPYTIIAGSTRMVSGSKVVEGARQTLVQRLKSLNLLHTATAVAFFGEDNDIAVSVARIREQPTGRTPLAVSHVVPCDHITYFSTGAGLEALAKLLAPATVPEPEPAPVGGGI